MNLPGNVSATQNIFLLSSEGWRGEGDVAPFYGQYRPVRPLRAGLFSSFSLGYVFHSSLSFGVQETIFFLHQHWQINLRISNVYTNGSQFWLAAVISKSHKFRVLKLDIDWLRSEIGYGKSQIWV